MLSAALSLILSVASAVHSGMMRATHYGFRFEGRTMANGKPYRSRGLTVACNRYPLGTVVRVLNPATMQVVYVTVTDRTRNANGIDLSEAAFDLIGLSRRKGWGWVTVSKLRSG